MDPKIDPKKWVPGSPPSPLGKGLPRGDTNRFFAFFCVFLHFGKKRMVLLFLCFAFLTIFGFLPEKLFGLKIIVFICVYLRLCLRLFLYLRLFASRFSSPFCVPSSTWVIPWVVWGTPWSKQTLGAGVSCEKIPRTRLFLIKNCHMYDQKAYCWWCVSSEFARVGITSADVPTPM